MIVCMAATRNWYFYLATNLYALLKHNKVDKVYLFIEDDEIKYLKDPRIKFININNLPEYIKQSSPNYNTHYTRMTFARCYFSKVLDEDKVLYIDADAIAVDDISEFWNTELGDNLLAGVHESGEWDKHLKLEGFDNTYINTGILLMDLKRIREQQLDDKMLDLLNNKYYYLPDQDVINIVFKDKIQYVDNRYNSTETTGFRDDAKIIHYIRERKGWVKGSPRSEIWFKYQDEMLGGLKMEEITVVSKIDFNDYLGKPIIEGTEYFHRNVGDKWVCNKERADYLVKANAVDIVEVKKVELPKVEETKREVKPVTKKTTTKRTTKKK